jgi:MoaA/NifB/PqqE/SkfB family radical SAM enzyme
MLSPTIFAQFFKKLPGPIYRWLGRRYIDGRFPRHIFIELTSSCQLSCSYCPRPRVSHHLPFELFKKIVDEASSFGKRSFSLHLFGEPLLYPRILESIEYLKSRGHAVILTTNGLLLGELYQKLRRVDKIIWSYKKEVKVSEALKRWKNFTVRFFEKREDLSWPRFEIRNYHNYGGLVSTAPFTGNRYPCYHPFLAPAVRANGDIVICCADPLGKSVVGNIRKMTLSEAWKMMEWTRQQHLAGVYRGICEKCSTWASYPSLW